MRYILFILVVSLNIIGHASAANWSTTNIQFLSGDNYQIGTKKREIVTLEHASKWSFGDNYFFFDVTNPTEDDTSIYGEYLTRFSLLEVFAKQRSSGFLKDVLLAASMEWGEEIHRYLVGVGFDFNIPHFNFFKANIYRRDDPKQEGSTFQLTLAWLFKYSFKSTTFIFEGFTDYVGAEGVKKSYVLAAPRLLLDISQLWKKRDTLFVGVEYQYWYRKFGIEGKTESVPQLMIKWIL
jgi:nucleoside-specific outer membrane channel protein Tsx